MDMDNKLCRTCRITKPLLEFSKDKSRPKGIYSQCKACVRKRQKKSICKDKSTDSRLQKVYKISLSIYNALKKYQKECCAICGIHESKTGRQLSVDHCHKTGIIRGLLCIKCNSAIGNFNDSIYFLKKAIEYLEPTENFKTEI